MGQHLSVATPIATFNTTGVEQLTAAMDAELDQLTSALQVAYDPSAQTNADQRSGALRVLREWRDTCLTGPNRLMLLPCIMQRAFERAAASGDPASVQVKFLCTLCPPWARQVLPEAPSETATIGTWAAAGAAMCSAGATASARQFCAAIAVSTLFASLGEATPLQHAYGVLAAAFGTALEQGQPAAVLCVLESIDALVTEVSNRALPLPNESRYILKRAIFTQTTELLGMVDGFIQSMPTPVSTEVLECGCNLIARCVDLATANVATDPTGLFTLQPKFLDQVPRTALFDQALRSLEADPTGPCARAVCNMFVAIAGLTNDPSPRTGEVMNGVFAAVGGAITYALQAPGSFDGPDIESLTNVVATFVEMLIENAAHGAATHAAGTPEQIAALDIVTGLQRALEVVLKLPNADPTFSSTAHATIAIAARSLHPHNIPELEPGDPADIYAELVQGNAKRATAAANLREMIFVPALDALFSFCRDNDAEWTDGVEAYIIRRCMAISRNVAAEARAASPVTTGPQDFSAAVSLDGDVRDDAMDDGDGEADDGTRVVNVVGGVACDSYASAVHAVSLIVHEAPFPADDWLPLAMAHETFKDSTVMRFVSKRDPHAAFSGRDDALLLATAYAVHNRAEGLDFGVVANFAVAALQATVTVRSHGYLAAAYCLVSVVAACDAANGAALEAIAHAVASSQQAMCQLAPLPRFDDPTHSDTSSLHYLLRLAATKVTLRLLNSGSMEAFASIAGCEAALTADVGGVALVLDALWVVRSVLAIAGVSEPALRALYESAVAPVFAHGHLAVWLQHASAIKRPADAAASRELTKALASVLSSTLRAVAPHPGLVQSLTTDVVTGNLQALCGTPSGSAAAVTLVFPIALVAGDGSELAALPGQVFTHVAGLLGAMETEDALDTAAALFAAFSEMGARSETLAAGCAGTVFTAAQAMLPSLAAASSADMSVNWPMLQRWMLRLAATFDATRHLPHIDPQLTIPTSAAAAAVATFRSCWRRRAALTTSRHDDEEDEEDWVVSERCRDGLCGAIARWCSMQPAGFEALVACATAAGPAGTDANTHAGKCHSAEQATEMFKWLIGQA